MITYRVTRVATHPVEKHATETVNREPKTENSRKTENMKAETVETTDGKARKS